MSHRIEIELTSQTSPDTWTWRASGAKQPRGTVPSRLVPKGTVPGAVLRAEVEVTLDGTSVLALLPLKGKSAPRVVERIEIKGAAHSGPDVNVIPASKGKIRSRSERTDHDRPRGTGSNDRGPRPVRASGGTDAARSDSRGGAVARRDRPARPGTREGSDAARRPAPATVHRNAALAGLKPEQLPIAEQLLRGGIPAVRQAIAEQNGRARADGRPEVTPAPLLALAEQLLPLITLASWKDRASMAQASGKNAPLRELRSVVASASTVSLDEDGRVLATSLRAALNERVTALRDRWVERIATALTEGRIVDALRTSIRPPEPSTRLSAELAVRLAEAAGRAMSPSTPAAEWTAILEVVVDSPVRRTVKPAGLPADPDEALVVQARKASGYVPELARLLGIPIPPPPGPRRPTPARASTGRRAG